jgi:hypothetical protein
MQRESRALQEICTDRQLDRAVEKNLGLHERGKIVVEGLEDRVDAESDGVERLLKGPAGGDDVRPLERRQVIGVLDAGRLQGRTEVERTEPRADKELDNLAGGDLRGAALGEEVGVEHRVKRLKQTRGQASRTMRWGAEESDME